MGIEYRQGLICKALRYLPCLRAGDSAVHKQRGLAAFQKEHAHETVFYAPAVVVDLDYFRHVCTSVYIFQYNRPEFNMLLRKSAA
jgi:hypothetical protein